MKNGKKQILFVEDEYKIQKMVKEFLEWNDYSVLTAEDGKQALELFYAYSRDIDLILLDMMLPVLNGMSVLNEIRQFSKIPVIILSAKNTISDQINGLYGGADDYMTKPFSLKLLKAHIETVLRRFSAEEEGEWICGKLKLNEKTRESFMDGKIMELTPKEFDLLLFFIKNEHIVLSRDSILDSVWGYSYEGDSRTVDTHVKQIRSKLTSKCPYIRSIYGVGYKFEVKDV